jgi:hypothetical protein
MRLKRIFQITTLSRKFKLPAHNSSKQLIQIFCSGE